MFERIISFIKEVKNKMFEVKTLKQVFKEDVAISQEMLRHIELWTKMYRGCAPWVNEDVKSLKLEQGICREFANICLNEMEFKVSNKTLDDICQYAIRDLNEHLQAGLALGSFCIKPLGENKIEYVTADKFIPVEFDARGRLIKVIFIEVKRIGDNNFYFRFEYHSLNDATSDKRKSLTIINKAFHSSNATSIGNEVPLTSIDEWAKYPTEITYEDVDRPDFGYYRNPIKNTVDDSFCGVSIFNSAIDLIKKADTQFERLEWEFESGERAINVDIAALQPQNVVGGTGTRLVMPKLNKRLYKGLNLSAGDNKELYEEFSPDFRDSNIINGANAFLRRIEFNVSLSYGDLSDAADVEKTATEIVTAKKRKYNMVTAIQSNLKDCLEDLVYALAFYNALTKSGYECVCNFNDSILVDEETERQQDRQDVAMGAMTLLEYRMKWYGETEAEASKKIVQETDTLD